MGLMRRLVSVRLTTPASAIPMLPRRWRELVRCASLAAAANAGMALNTARNHLQSIFRKCGATSQTEAVQLFSRLI